MHPDPIPRAQEAPTPVTLSIDPDPATPSSEGPATANPAEPHAHRVRNTAIGICVLATLLGVLAVLASRADTSVASWHGQVLPSPQRIPDIRLTDTDGEPFSLIDDTPGDLTLLMFGYTNCPDICPISLGTLAAALDELGPDVANRVDMVFVTADPDRDDLGPLRTYLDGYDPEFIGLRGTATEIAEAQDLAKVPRAVIETPDDDGGYIVGHATQIIAYQDDGTARIAYPFGTRSQDWINDIPRLLAGEIPDE